MIYSLRLGKREIFLSETEPLGSLSLIGNGAVDLYQELRVLGTTVEVGIGKNSVFPSSQKNYSLVLTVARVVGLVAGGVPFEAALTLSAEGVSAVRLGVFAVSELLGERKAFNLSLEGAKAFDYERVLRSEFNGTLSESGVSLLELFRTGYYTRIVGDGHGEVDVEELSPGSPVFVVREENPNHRFAVKFLSEDGRKLGYMRRGIADLVAPEMDRGLFLKAEVVQLLLDRPVNRRVYVKVVEL